MKTQIKSAENRGESKQIVFGQILARLRDDIGRDLTREREEDTKGLGVFEDAVQALCS